MSSEYKIRRDGNALRKVEVEERQLKVYKRPKKKKHPISVVDICILVLVAVVIAGGFASFLKVQSEVTTLSERLSKATSDYEKAKNENDLYEKRIESNINLARIEQIAITELGMTLAGEGQIEFYDDDLEDYVKQYEALPTN